jgi:hypothetical protein
MFSATVDAGRREAYSRALPKSSLTRGSAVRACITQPTSGFILQGGWGGHAPSSSRDFLRVRFFMPPQHHSLSYNEVADFLRLCPGAFPDQDTLFLCLLYELTYIDYASAWSNSSGSAFWRGVLDAQRSGASRAGQGFPFPPRGTCSERRLRKRCLCSLRPGSAGFRGDANALF